jgi:hypothetical protein
MGGCGGGTIGCCAHSDEAVSKAMIVGNVRPCPGRMKASVGAGTD